MQEYSAMLAQDLFSGSDSGFGDVGTGYGLNVGAAGAYAAPEGGGPVIDTTELAANATSGTSDGFQTQMDPSHVAGMSSANAALGPGLISNARQAIGNADQQQGPAPLPDAPPTSLPDMPPPSPFGGGFTAGANSSGVSGLFGAPIAPWTQSTSLAMGGAPPWDPNDQGAMAGQQAVNQAMGKSLSGWSSSGGGGGQSGGGVIPSSDYPTAAESNYGSGFDDSVWSGLGPGISTVGQNEAAGGPPVTYGDDLGGITTVAQDDASGMNDVSNRFGRLGADPVSNTAYVPATGFESRGFDPVTGSNRIQSGDLYSGHASFMAKFYSG